eukprot:8205059-Pyramimonas_sp.AAC.1
MPLPSYDIPVGEVAPNCCLPPKKFALSLEKLYADSEIIFAAGDSKDFAQTCSNAGWYIRLRVGDVVRCKCVSMGRWDFAWAHMQTLTYTYSGTGARIY